jgi:hypothetical protein
MVISVLGLLGLVGLLAPREAEARRAHKTSGSKGTVAAQSETSREGRHRHMAKGKANHPKKRGREANVVCAAAFEKAKETARASQIRASSEWFAVCARPTCGRALRQKCAAVQPKVAALLASVVPTVSGAPASTTRDVVVRMDGEVLTSTLDGTAIVIDPGDHQFTFAKDGEIFATRSLTVDRSQRNLIVSVSLQSKTSNQVDLSPAPIVEDPAMAAPKLAHRKSQATDAVADSEAAAHGAVGGAVEGAVDGAVEGAVDDEPALGLARSAGARRPGEAAASRKGAPWSAYALAGVGLLGVGGYWTFNLKGSADNDALAVLCKPDCNPTSVHHVRNLYLAADISLGIGVAALIGSTYLFLRSNDTEAERPRSRASHISELSVAPTASGALATVGGTF